jgi:hypothetical protein
MRARINRAQQRKRSLIMETTITRLRTICWIGAVADLIFAVAMVVPPLWGWLFGIENYAPTLQHRLDMGVGASLMLGWTCLLLWAGQDPVGRRGVMALTIFPVLIGLGVTAVLSLYTGANTISNLTWVFGMKVVLFSIFGYGFVTARRLAGEVE